MGITRDWAIGGAVAALNEFIFGIAGSSGSKYIEMAEGIIQLTITMGLCKDLQNFLKILSYPNPNGLFLSAFFALLYSPNMLAKLKGTYVATTKALLLYPGGFYSNSEPDAKKNM